MKNRMPQFACLCLMLFLVAPPGLRAQDKPEAKPKNARRADELDSLKQGRLSRQHEKLAREMEEMGERLRFELAPGLQELQGTLPTVVEELAPALAGLESSEIDAELAELRELPIALHMALPELAGFPEMLPIPEIPPLPEIPPMPVLAPHAPLLDHGFHRSGIPSRYKEYLSADESVRAEALRSLLHQDEKLALPELQKMKSHQNWAMRAVVVGMLGEIETKEAVTILREVLQNDLDQRVRRAAVRALARRPEPEARAALQELWRK